MLWAKPLDWLNWLQDNSPKKTFQFWFSAAGKLESSKALKFQNNKKNREKAAAQTDGEVMKCADLVVWWLLPGLVSVSPGHYWVVTCDQCDQSVCHRACWPPATGPPVYTQLCCPHCCTLRLSVLTGLRVIFNTKYQNWHNKYQSAKQALPHSSPHSSSLVPPTKIGITYNYLFVIAQQFERELFAGGSIPLD